MSTQLLEKDCILYPEPKLCELECQQGVEALWAPLQVPHCPLLSAPAGPYQWISCQIPGVNCLLPYPNCPGNPSPSPRGDLTWSSLGPPGPCLLLHQQHVQLPCICILTVPPPLLLDRGSSRKGLDLT